MSRLKCRLPIVAIGAGALLLACGGSDPSDDALSLGGQSGFLAELDVQDDVTLACSGSATARPIGFEDIDGVVALPTSPTHPALHASARTATDGSTYYFAKTGLLWTAPAVFELSVPADLRSSMAIGWGGPAQAAHTVKMSCDDDTAWVALLGGFDRANPDGLKGSSDARIVAVIRALQVLHCIAKQCHVDLDEWRGGGGAATPVSDAGYRLWRWRCALPNRRPDIKSPAVQRATVAPSWMNCAPRPNILTGV